MNQPLYIDSKQVKSSPPPEPTTEGSLNPTSTTPGLSYSSPNPTINITLDQPTTLTLIYLPVDRPNEPSNVKEFTVVFYYPDGTTSKDYPSETPLLAGTTTTSAGLPTETTTTPSTNVIYPPSSMSPRVDLPPNFNVPEKTIVSITITSTTDESNPTGVSVIL